MTSFFFGNEGGLNLAQAVSYMFWTDDLLICHAHSRGMHLQPFTKYDREQGFGKLGCPFCQGGALHGTFSRYRSKRSVSNALDKLVLTLSQRKDAP